MSQHASWQRYPWPEYYGNNQESNALLRPPDGSWRAAYADTPRQWQCAKDWDAQEEEIRLLWAKWLYFQREEGLQYVMRVANRHRRELGVKEPR